MSASFAAPTPNAVPLHLIARAEAENWLAARGVAAQNAAKTQNWSGHRAQTQTLRCGCRIVHNAGTGV